MKHSEGDRWREQVYERVAAAVRSARARRSAQEIADETERLGVPISRAQLSNFETGRRQSMDIADLMVIAAALGVPPITLLFGGHPDAEMELLPGQVETTLVGLAWFTGDWELTDTDAIFQGHAVELLPWVNTEAVEAQLLYLIRERRAKRIQGKVMTRLAEGSGDPSRIYEAHKISYTAEILDKQITQLIQEQSRDGDG